jgi:hypothetical protein
MRERAAAEVLRNLDESDEIESRSYCLVCDEDDRP